MAAAITETYLNDIITNVAAVLNLEDWKHSMLSFESIGQNFFGILIPSELYGKKNGKEVKIRLVLKLAPTDEKYRVSGAVTRMFAREIFVYTTLIHEYQASQKKFALDVYIVPSCYYVCRNYCREVIVLQDMTADDYKPYTQDMFLDTKHIEVSLKSLAIFHASSFILRHTNNKCYGQATKVCLPLTLQSNQRFMDILEDRLAKAIESFKDTTYVSLFKSLKGNHVRLVEASWDSVIDTCICHGDLWKENILFKYESDEPISACLIDYQTACVSSPAYDVLYLIASSADATVRRTHFQNLLDVYYRQFERVLKQAGLDTREVYSRASLETDLKTVAPACLIVVNTAMWLASGCQQEGHVRSKRVLSTDDERAAAIGCYKTIIKGVIDDFLHYGYLSSNM